MIRRDSRVSDTPEHEVHRALCDRQRRVHVPRDLRGGPLEVDGHRRAVDGHGDPNRDVPVGVAVTLNNVTRAVGAVGDRPEFGLDTLPGVVDDRVERRQQAVAVVCEQFPHPFARPLVRATLCPQVRTALSGVAHVRQQQPLDGIVALAAGDVPNRRYPDALGVYLAGTGRHTARCRPADIGVVGPGDGVRHGLPVVGERRDECHVRQVCAALKRVVEEEHVARPGVAVEHRRHCLRHRPQVDRDVLGLCHHPPLAVEQCRRAVPPLGYVRRVGTTHEHCPHLLGDALELCSQNLQLDRVEPVGHVAPSRSIRSVPWSSTVARHPGGTTVVLSPPATTAGPASDAPAGGRRS